jgi:hypothetical protein
VLQVGHHVLFHQRGDLQGLAHAVAYQPEVVRLLLGAGVRVDPGIGTPRSPERTAATASAAATSSAAGGLDLLAPTVTMGTIPPDGSALLADFGPAAGELIHSDDRPWLGNVVFSGWDHPEPPP